MFFLANYQDRIENLSKACEYSESDSTLGSNFCLDYAEALEEDQKSTKAQIQDAFDKRLVLLVIVTGVIKRHLFEKNRKVLETELLLQQYGKVCIPVPGLWSQKYYNDALQTLKRSAEED